MTTDPWAGLRETGRTPQDRGAAAEGGRSTRAPVIGIAVSAILALAAGGCTLHADRPVALATPDAPASLGHEAAVDATVERPTHADDAAVTVAALPTPKQIFDFHPPGAKADTWRQPFIIDPNDGPLASDVRKTAAELKAFLALAKDKTVAGRRCGETDVATAKPGCGAAPPKETPAAQAAAGRRAAAQ